MMGRSGWKATAETLWVWSESVCTHVRACRVLAGSGVRAQGSRRRVQDFGERFGVSVSGLGVQFKSVCMHVAELQLVTSGVGVQGSVSGDGFRVESPAGFRIGV